MESGCKQLGLARLKIAGARWSPEGAKLVAKARATYLSGRWDQINSVSGGPVSVKDFETTS
jgi:hypothetical protein